MTITDRPTPSPAQTAAVELYRDIHKGIRAELFSVTLQAGSVDPHDQTALSALSAQVHSVAEVLEIHAGHEDNAIQPVLANHLPALFDRIETDHQHLDRRVRDLGAAADDTLTAAGRSRAGTVRGLYLELADFTGAYLIHQDYEERVVQPALAEAVGPDALMGVHVAIISSIPPDQMARSLAFMLPAMNIDDRAELLGGMRMGAPAEVFEGIWGLAASILAPADHAALGARLGLV